MTAQESRWSLHAGFLIAFLPGLLIPPVRIQSSFPVPTPMKNVVKAPIAQEPISQAEPSELVLVDWNIERGVQLPGILEALRGPLAADIYVLQEVDRHTRRTGYRDIAAELARELRMEYVFAIEFEELAQGRSGQPAFQGQAVLSRFPVSNSRALEFRTQLHNWGPWWKPRWSWLQPRRGGRIAQVVEFTWNGRRCVIYNTHLESKADDSGRTRQMREILEDLKSHYPPDTPAIIAGDFNTKKGAASPVLQELFASGFEDVCQYLPGSLRTKVTSNKRADWIFVRHFRSTDASIPRLYPSDHFPLMVRLSLLPAGKNGTPVVSGKAGRSQK